jgi:hypothetical protein
MNPVLCNVFSSPTNSRGDKKKKKLFVGWVGKGVQEGIYKLVHKVVYVEINITELRKVAAGTI